MEVRKASIIEAYDLEKTDRIQSSTTLTFNVARGEILLLAGGTGTGKTTVLDLISGYESLGRGKLVLSLDVEIVFSSRGWFPFLKTRPEYLARLGLGRSFQHPLFFSTQTVGETLHGCAHFVNSWSNTTNTSNLYPALLELLEQVGVKKGQPANELSFGQLKLLNSALALIVGRHLVLLDEPLAGLAQDLCGKFLDILKGACKNRCVVVVEHRLPQGASFWDKVIRL